MKCMLTGHPFLPLKQHSHYFLHSDNLSLGTQFKVSTYPCLISQRYLTECNCFTNEEEEIKGDNYT
jgi:hypothetical protein